MDVLVVFDPNSDAFLDNRIFDEKYAKKFPGALAISKLKRALHKINVEIVTADRYLADPPSGKRVFLISEMITERYDAVIKKGAFPLLLLTGESPNVAWRFYFGLKKYSSKFKYAMLFSGFRPFVHSHTDFLNFYWPNSNLKDRPRELDWEERKLLVMIAANKKRVDKSKSLKGLAKFLMWSSIRYFNRLFDFKDLYQTRLEAVLFFSNKGNFELFGKDWTSSQNLGPKYRRAIDKLNPSPVDSKLDQLSKYRFALCFENCVFPGYLTEKIFDCFLARCIPIYYGAPDIDKFVPTETFIDFRQFKNFHELKKYIEQMTQGEFVERIKAIEEYLESKEFDFFTDAHFVKSTLNIIQAESKGN